MKISEKERRNNKLNRDSLVQALRLLRECGYVILEAVLPSNWVEGMCRAYNEEVKRQFVGETPTGHGGISAPLRMPFLDPLAIENPFAMQILKEAMGDDIFSYFPYGSNTAWPSCGIQHIHRDTGHLFPNEPYVLPISLAVVNIALADFTEENGATEVWPSSHLITDLQHNDNNTLEERATQLPSIRIIMPAGSVVVRDMRCWHRGMPNQTQEIRSMLALVYFRRFHHLPDNAQTFRHTIPPEVWEQMPPQAQKIYRYNQA
tara:strand:+ start:873 stop:1655 length:783 start_codon:yes stop_codon:yes gene_type:complete